MMQVNSLLQKYYWANLIHVLKNIHADPESASRPEKGETPIGLQRLNYSGRGVQATAMRSGWYRQTANGAYKGMPDRQGY